MAGKLGDESSLQAHAWGKKVIPEVAQVTEPSTGLGPVAATKWPARVADVVLEINRAAPRVERADSGSLSY